MVRGPGKAKYTETKRNFKKYPEICAGETKSAPKTKPITPTRTWGPAATAQGCPAKHVTRYQSTTFQTIGTHIQSIQLSKLLKLTYN